MDNRSWKHRAVVAELLLEKIYGKTQFCPMCEDWAKKADGLVDILEHMRLDYLDDGEQGYCLVCLNDECKPQCYRSRAKEALKAYRDGGAK